MLRNKYNQRNVRLVHTESDKILLKNGRSKHKKIICLQPKKLILLRWSHPSN